MVNMEEPKCETLMDKILAQAFVLFDDYIGLIRLTMCDEGTCRFDITLGMMQTLLLFADIVHDGHVR